MTFGSAFAGTGGFDLGFERAGMTGLWQIERDKECNRVLEQRFPNARRFGDIKTVDPGELADVDVLCGGIPCQDYSLAGKRAGLAGDRGALWWPFHLLLGFLKPRFAVVENVVGLLGSNEGRDFATILAGLEEHGYRWAYRVLDSRWFGIPQTRRRVIVVASLGDFACARVLFDGAEVRDVSPSYSCHEMEPSGKVVGTLDCRSRTRFAHWNQILWDGTGLRGLTDDERDLVQGFPAGWGSVCSSNQRGKQTGNAFPPPMAEWLGRRIMAATPKDDGATRLGASDPSPRGSVKKEENKENGATKEGGE